MNKQIISLVGPAGSGKTTLANLMVSQGFHRMRFAEPLKRMIGTLLFDQGVPLKTIFEMLEGSLKEIPSKFLSGATPRHAMQTLGTEWRDLIHKELWVDIWEQKVTTNTYTGIIIDDMRFLHEAQRVKKLNGKIFRIQRPNTTHRLHISEREYEKIEVDGIVANDRDPPHMLTQMNAFLEALHT